MTPSSAAKTIGRYQLLDPIEAGPNPRAFLAILQGPSGFRKRVAVRLLEHKPDKLVGEGRNGLPARHASLVKLYDVGKAEANVWFAAMEFVDGPSVAKLIDYFGALPGRAVAELGIQATAGLAAVHKNDEVHGYLTARGLLVGGDGQVKIGGLGWPSKATGYQPLTIPIASEPWSDIFAMGVVLWQAAVGAHPFLQRTPRDTAMAVIEASSHVRSEDSQAALSAALPGLENVVRRCVDETSSDRFTQIRDLRRALLKLRPRESEGLVELLARYDTEVADDSEPQSVPETPDLVASGSVPSEANEPMFGRLREQSAVLSKLKTGERAITLKALSGMGKTRLALRVANLRKQAGQPVIWCALGEQPDLTSLLSTIGTALSLEFEGATVQDLEAQVGRALASLDEALLVLDGLELVESEVRRCLDETLRQAPGLQLLATSHCPLGLTQEVVLELGPLQFADAVELFEHAAPTPLSSDQHATLERLVRALDAVPLGIRLAASTLAETTPSSLLEQLTDRAAVLPLDQTIDLQMNASPDWVVAALAQLSVFEGRFSLEAATGVLDLHEWPAAPWPLDVMQSLWHRSMICSQERSSHTEMWLLASVRRRARQAMKRLGLEASARHAHASWFARMGTQEALARLRGPGGLARMRALTEAYADLLSAAQWSLEQRNVELAVPLTLALGEVVLVCGAPDIGVDQIHRCLELGPSNSQTAYLHILRAELAWRGRDLATQNTSLDAAERASRGNPSLLARVSLGRALTGLSSEDAHETARRAKLAMRRAKAAGNPRFLAESGRVLGIARRDQGQTEEAERLLLRARSLFEEIGDDAGAAGVDQSLGLLYQGMGRFEDAINCHTMAADANRRAGRIGPRATALQALGVALRITQRFDEAESVFHKALRTFRSLGNLGGEANCLSGLANIRSSRGDSDGAMNELTKVAEIHKELGSMRQYAVVSNNLACLYAERRQYDEARSHYASSLQACRDAGLIRMIPLPMGNLGVTLVDDGHLDEGIRRLREAMNLASDARQFRFAAAFSGEIARGLLFKGDLKGCENALDNAELRLREIGDRVELAKTLAVRAMWHHRRGQPDLARHVFQEVQKLARGNRQSGLLARIDEARRSFT